MPLVLALPSKWTVLPLPVHTIYAAKHAWKASSCVGRQQSLCISGSWLPQVLWAKHLDHSLAKLAFLVRGESKLAKGIRLALEVWVMSNHSLSDTIEHMPCHTKTATKFIRLEERGVGKVIGIEQGVASLPVAVQVGSTARD